MQSKNTSPRGGRTKKMGLPVIENFKNFLRHGKQARQNAEPTTNVSNVHAQSQHQRYNQHPDPVHHGISEPVMDHKPLQNHAAPHGDFSVGAGAGDNRNIAAQAGDAAAHAAAKDQKKQAAAKNAGVDPSVLERIVAEEREAKGKLPRYPGLERWTLLEKMGDGAFSNVYRARDTTGQWDEVAIKVVRKFEMNSQQRANILKEVQIMRQLDHPNIVKLIDFSESRQYYYIVLELCPGGELFHQIVRLTYFSEDLSRHTIIQVAKALQYLHEEAGVVHRDIKPENLLFYPTPFIPTRNPKPRGPDDEDKADEGEFVKGKGAGGIGLIKIADFGLSKVIWDTQTMTPCGTVGYTAPEIVKDERYSKSVDMWALGCVLYTLLCGFPPFYDESIQTLTEKVARGQYTFLSPWWDDISKSAQDLVSHLLTVDPEKRYDINQFLNHPWIREADEPTYSAYDAPPLATPAAKKERLQPDFSHLESPGARRMDFRSPGAVNLREVFDVSYAVHRQEEEGKRKKQFKQGYRGANAMNSLNALDEGEDDDEYAAESVPYDPSSQHPPAKLPKSQGADVTGMEQMSILWHAGASSVSISGIQLALADNASAVFATARQDEKCDFIVNHLGATKAFNTTKENWSEEVLKATGGKGVDIIVDFVGADYFQGNLDAAARDGHIVQLGVMSGTKLDGKGVDIGAFVRKRVRFEGSTLRSRDEEYQGRLRDQLVEHALPKFKDGSFKVFVEKVFPFEQIVDAHKLLESNKTKGKIICTIS